MSVGILVTLVVLGLAALALAVFLSVLVHRPVTAIWTLVLVSAVVEGLRDAPALEFWVGSLRIGALDVAVLVLGGLAGYRLLAHGVSRVVAPACLLLLVVLHLARGVDVHGLQAAVNSSRSWLYFTAALAFAATVRDEWRRAAYDAIVVGGLGLAVFGLTNVATSGVAVAGTTFWNGVEWVDARVITAAGSLLVLSALLLLVTSDGYPPLVRAGGAAMCIAAIVLIPHRTIWAAAIASGLVLFINWSRARHSDSPELVYGFTGVLLLATPFIAWGVTQSELIRMSVENATAERSTFSWRTESWGDLLSQYSSATHAVFGAPAGEDWTRMVGSSITNVAPHNSYLESYLRFGVAGVIAVAAIALLAFSGARHARVAAPAYGLAALAVAHLVYGVTYQFAMICGLVLGVLCRAAIQPTRASRPALSMERAWQPLA